MSLAFLICVERGPLESQSLLFVASLRRFGGAHAEAPVYAFTPRRGHEPGPATLAELRDLGAAIVAEPLNERHAQHPTWNKVFAAAWAERELEHDTLAFSDSDCVVLNDPAELERGEWLAAVKPVGVSRAASAGPDDAADEWWRRLYDALGEQAEPYVTTVVDRRRVRAYWNAGLVVTRRAAGLMAAWQDVLERLVDAGVVHAKPELMDQMSLAGALAGRHDDIWELPDAYNYPLPQRARLPQEAAALGLDGIVHAHLHRWAHVPGFLDELEPPLPDCERRRWLAERLPLLPEQEGSFRKVQARRRARAET